MTSPRVEHAPRAGRPRAPLARAVLRRRPRSGRAALNPLPWYALTPWHGMRYGTWIRLLRDHRFRVSRSRLALRVTGVTVAAAINSIASRLQQVRYGRAIAATNVPAPIFIVGHWRSGTTMLHELLSLDPQFAYPTTMACFAPTDFLVLRPVLGRLSILVPARRPMDDMPMRMDLPQEDEYALLNLGVPSPYLAMAFPNDPPPHLEYLDLEALPAAARARWMEAFRGFLQAVTMGDGRRLVLKSPTHTARIRTLVELFPDARFVHMVRDPRAVYPSTVRLWSSLDEAIGFQEPTDRGLEEYVFSTFERLYEAFDRQRSAVPSGHLVEVRYEDLVGDPLTELRRVYTTLGLEGFERVVPSAEAYFAERRAYRPRSYPRDPELERTLRRRWGRWMTRYGYFDDGADTDAADAEAADGEPATEPAPTLAPVQR